MPAPERTDTYYFERVWVDEGTGGTFELPPGSEIISTQIAGHRGHILVVVYRIPGGVGMIPGLSYLAWANFGSLLLACFLLGYFGDRIGLRIGRYYVRWASPVCRDCGREGSFSLGTFWHDHWLGEGYPDSVACHK